MYPIYRLPRTRSQRLRTPCSYRQAAIHPRSASIGYRIDIVEAHLGLSESLGYSERLLRLSACALSLAARSGPNPFAGPFEEE